MVLGLQKKESAEKKAKQLEDEANKMNALANFIDQDEDQQMTMKEAEDLLAENGLSRFSKNTPKNYLPFLKSCRFPAPLPP